MKNLLIIAIMSFAFLSACQSDSPDKSNKATLKIAFQSEPTTLDPRLGTDLYTANVIQMLYEGLMRIDYQGKVVPGIAEVVDVSPDELTYTFHLRDAVWSDGTALTAKDFKKTWLSLLDPAFPSPNAYQFYYIKGAKEYKENRGSVEDVGIKALDAKTLQVELESPTPYFLKLVSSVFYMPVHPDMRQNKLTENHAISNGPFIVKEWKNNDELVLIKNPNYWDSKIVSIDTLILVILDENTAFKMFVNGHLDRAGSPTSTLPQDSIATLKSQQELKIKPGAGIHWFRFNTEASPLNHAKMRKAFNLALDRKSLVDHVMQGNQIPAIGIIPSVVGWNTGTAYYKDHDIPGAWNLFQEALIEMNIDKDSIPPITLIYAANDRNHKIAQAVQQQWNKAFGIQVKLESQEVKIFAENVLKGNYQIAVGSFFADYSDPISFLEIFKYKKNATNRTRWENPDFTALLNASYRESQPEKRMAILQRAEAILMDHMPVAPICFASFNYLESENIGGVGLSDLGLLDLKYAFIEDYNEIAAP